MIQVIQKFNLVSFKKGKCVWRRNGFNAYHPNFYQFKYSLHHMAWGKTRKQAVKNLLKFSTGCRTTIENTGFLCDDCMV